jgi:hypothetical protein
MEHAQITVTRGKVQRRSVAGLAAFAVLASSQTLSALTPPPPCELREAHMQVGDVQELGDYDSNTGVVVERYNDPSVPNAEGVYVNLSASPVKALHGFTGTRVTHCASGRFLALKDRFDPYEVNTAISATEFARSSVQAKKPVSFDALRRAAQALYGDYLVLRETEETCACNIFFPDLRPAEMGRYLDRTDIEERQ